MERIPQNLPPYLYITQIAEHCPKALATYLILWREADKQNKVVIGKKEVRSEFLVSLAKFRHDLLLLAKEALVSVDETPNALHIELVGWEDESDDFLL